MLRYKIRNLKDQFCEQLYISYISTQSVLIDVTLIATSNGIVECIVTMQALMLSHAYGRPSGEGLLTFHLAKTNQRFNLGC